MNRVQPPYRVHVGLVTTGYLDPMAIERTVEEGLKFCRVSTELDALPPGGKLVVVPDVTMADGTVARHAYTHPEFMRSALAGLFRLTRADAWVLGRSFQDVPVSRIFSRAGYGTLASSFPGRVELVPGDRCETYRYQLSKGGIVSAEELASGALRSESRSTNEILAPRELHLSEYTVYCPKLKSHTATQGFAGAIRLGDPAYRGRLADQYLCDLLEVSNPNLVISDGLIAAVGGNEVTQRGHELGVVLVANNALAHDWIAAMILNLDPMKIDHLKIAAERGWGPTSLGQIELGGAGAEGVRNLAMKTSYWDLGNIRLGDFGVKFERENPGLAFPLEILSDVTPRCLAASETVLLDWLYLTYDFPRKRPSIARWPRASVYVGEARAYPSHATVFAVGDRACRSIDRLTSSSRRMLRLGRGSRIVLERAQLKNGRRHLIVKLPGNPPRLRDLVAAFAIGTSGRMSAPVLTRSLITDWLVSALRRWLKPAPPRTAMRLVMTSRMRQNAWWSLNP